MDPITQENKLLSKTFLFMFLGLLVSGLTAWYTYSSGLVLNIMFSGSFYLLLFLEVGVVLFFNFLFKKLPPIAVTILYFLYAIVNGLTLSVIFVVSYLTSIIYLFALSAIAFAVLAFIGFNTKQNLYSWKPYITTFLILAMVLSLINIFVQNSSFDLFVDLIVLAVFCGVTIYDLNVIKQMQENNIFPMEKMYIYCAMQLYLDFINIFLRVLSIFGKRRN